MVSEMTVHHTINGVPFEASEDSSQLRVDKEMEANKSARFWAKLNDETRDVYRKVAQVSLELLHGSVDYWLPHSLIENTAGDRVQINSEVLFLDIHSQVSQMDEATMFEEARMLEKIRSKVETNRAERTDDEFIEYVDQCIDHGSHLTNDEAKRLRDMVK